MRCVRAKLRERDVSAVARGDQVQVHAKLPGVRPGPGSAARGCRLGASFRSGLVPFLVQLPLAMAWPRPGPDPAVTNLSFLTSMLEKDEKKEVRERLRKRT